MDVFYSETSSMQQLRGLFGRPLSTPEGNHHFQVDKTMRVRYRFAWIEEDFSHQHIAEELIRATAEEFGVPVSFTYLTDLD
jgi:lipoate-protein ligase A